jgi:IS5 family transposase
VDATALRYGVHRGNPPDAPLLAPAIARIKALLGRAPRAATADRGYGEATVEDKLTSLGVKNVVIPCKGRPSKARRQVEHARGFRRLVKWRTGCEGRISYLKRRYGLDRTGFDGLEGAQTWCALAILADNTVKIAALVQAKSASAPAASTPPRSARPASAPRTTGPPGTPPPQTDRARFRLLGVSRVAFVVNRRPGLPRVNGRRVVWWVG